MKKKRIHQEHLQESIGSNMSYFRLKPFMSFWSIHITSHALTVLERLNQNRGMNKREDRLRERDIFPSTEVVYKPTQMRSFPREIDLRQHVEAKLLHTLIQPKPVQTRNESSQLGSHFDYPKVSRHRLLNARVSDFNSDFRGLNLLSWILKLESGSMNLSYAPRGHRGLVKLLEYFRDLTTERSFDSSFGELEAVLGSVTVKLRKMQTEILGEQVRSRGDPLTELDESRTSFLQSSMEDLVP